MITTADFAMKKGFVFFLGMVTGCVLTIGVLFYVAQVYNTDKDSGLTIYEQPAGVIDSRSFKVLQVFPNGNALAFSEDSNWSGHYAEPVVLLLAEESSHYYDELIVKIPKGKGAKQVGRYQYKTNDGRPRTVPAVRIMSK